MKKKGRIKEPHARHEISEDRKDAFTCLICLKAKFDKWIFEPWEMPRHLKEGHKIPRKRQIILGWKEKFEKEYLKNRNKPITYEIERIPVNNTPPEEYEKEKERIKKELEAQRNH